MNPSPHSGSLHSLVQLSTLESLPSSHSSPGPGKPSPQTFRVQSNLHALVLPLLAPSSHSSWPSQTKPSPQSAVRQERRQAPWLSLLSPLSHSSPGCLNPSPQEACLQTLVQLSLLLLLPSSQASSGALSPSPQNALVQLSLQ